MKPETIVVHSGGMDSSLCLALAVQEFGKDRVLSLSFDYGQRHRVELESAEKISAFFEVEHQTLPVEALPLIQESSLTDRTIAITKGDRIHPPNTMVLGRNGLFIHLAAIYAYSRGARRIDLGVIGTEDGNSGYRDCSQEYVSLMEKVIRLDVGDAHFAIRTPLIAMTKLETLAVASQLGILDYLLENSVTCYEGIKREGCTKCPSCLLRNRSLLQFQKKYPQHPLPYPIPLT